MPVQTAKFLKPYNIDMRESYILQISEVSVLGNYKISIGYYRTIYELIVIRIGCYKIPLVVCIVFISIRRLFYDFHDDGSDTTICFFTKYFLILFHYTVCNA